MHSDGSKVVWGGFLALELLVLPDRTWLISFPPHKREFYCYSTAATLRSNI